MTLLREPGMVNMKKAGEDEITFMLRAQDEFAESVNNMLRARDKLAESIVEINRLLAAYHTGQVEDGLNQHAFPAPARRGDKE